MKTTVKLAAITALSVFVLSMSSFAKDDPKASMPAMTPEQEKMMKAMEEAGKVTENHKAIQYLVGDWNMKSKFWAAPGAKPEEATGKAHFESMFDGRFIKETMESTAMGQPFQGVGHYGYDNSKKKYVTTWMDSMSTGIFTMEGESKDKGKTIESQGEFLCPVRGKEVRMRSVLKHVSKNEVRYEHYDQDANGKEFKAMEIVYKR